MANSIIINLEGTTQATMSPTNSMISIRNEFKMCDKQTYIESLIDIN